MCLCLGPPRQAQLWLCGLPGVGKTRFLAYLRARLRVYDMPRSEDFYDEYEDGCLTWWSWMSTRPTRRSSSLTPGLMDSSLPLRQKGSQLTKTDNLPLIIVSNYSIEEVYRPGIGRDALVDRFTQVFVDTAFVIDDPEHVE